MWFDELSLLLFLFVVFLFLCVLLWSYGVRGRGVFAFGYEIEFPVGSRWGLLGAVCVERVLARLDGLAFAGVPV